MFGFKQKRHKMSIYVPIVANRLSRRKAAVVPVQGLVAGKAPINWQGLFGDEAAVVAGENKVAAAAS